jgi:hypothetical protein
MKNNFWNDASRCGAVLGLIGVAFSVIGMYLPKDKVLLALILNGLSTVITIFLLFYFTKRRAAQFPKEGYSYLQCMGYMVASGLFAGIIAGAYQIVASHFFFAEEYNEIYNTMIAAYAQMNVFDNNQLEMIRVMLTSPISLLISNIMAMCLSFGFYGLFIAIGTKREVNIFDDTTIDQE